MIQLDIDPEVEQRAVEAARVHGLEPGSYAGGIVSDAVAYTAPKLLTGKEFRAVLDRLAERGKKLPALPGYAYTRESFFEDRD